MTRYFFIFLFCFAVFVPNSHAQGIPKPPPLSNFIFKVEENPRAWLAKSLTVPSAFLTVAASVTSVNWARPVRNLYVGSILSYATTRPLLYMKKYKQAAIGGAIEVAGLGLMFYAEDHIKTPKTDMLRKISVGTVLAGAIYHVVAFKRSFPEYANQMMQKVNAKTAQVQPAIIEQNGKMAVGATASIQF
jgi:hypothetical protein